MDRKLTSNLDEILNLDTPASMADNDVDVVVDAPETLTTSETPKKIGKWSDSVHKRLLIVAVIVGIPASIFVLLFGSMFELKEALEKNKTKTIEVASVKTVVEPEMVVQENLRGVNAVGDQARAIKLIEKQKLDTKPEIKLEPKVSPQKVEVPPVPTPVARTVSRPAPVGRRQTYNPRPQKQVVKKAVVTPQFDSMDDWNQLALVGSYGHGQSAVSDSAKGIKSVKDRLQNIPTTKLVSNVRASEASPQNQNLIALSESESQFLEALRQKPEKTVLPAVETGVKIAIAQQVKAKTIGALNWPEGIKNSPQRSFLRLEEDLLDVRGQVAINKGAVMIFEVVRVEGGVVVGSPLAIMEAGVKHSIPPGAVTVYSKKGDLLTAKYKQIKNGSGNADLLNFALGAAEQTSSLIDRPNSSFSQISSFGQSQGADYGDKNYPAAAISGGATEVIKNRTEELEHQRNNAPVSSFWQLKKGTDVLIQIDRYFNY